MKRSEFLKSIGIATTGLILPKHLLKNKATKVYDNYVRGLTHYDYKKLKDHLKAGDELKLIREKENIYDSFAIQIYYENHKLGYIAAYENIVLANIMDGGGELMAYVSENNPKKSYTERLAIEVFVDLVCPTEALIEELKNKRADDREDIYRKNYGL